jgi:hypothetical protein
MGHEDQFPPPRLSGRCRFSQGTFAGTGRSGRDAPEPGVPLLSVGRGAERALFFGEPIDEPVEEQPHLGA